MSTDIAIDLGYGNIKVYGVSGGLVMQSAVAIGDRQVICRMAGLRRTKPPQRVETKAGPFYVGPGAHDWGRPVENLDFGRLTGSPEMMALWYGALTRYGIPDEPTRMMIGLPVDALMGEDVALMQRAVRSAFRGCHSWQVDGETLHIDVESVGITSQAVGAMFDYLLDDSGTMVAARRMAFRREIAILGIGMNTVDLLVVREGSPVQRFTAGETLGVRRLLELANGEDAYSLAELDTQLRRHTLNVSEVLGIWQSEVIGFIERQWSGAFHRFSVVVGVGGGAILLREPLLRRFGAKLFVPDDPIISTARGLHKYTQMVARRRR